MLVRAVESVQKQTYQNFEHIIIDDGSVVPFNFKGYDRVKILHQPHLERIRAYNLAFEKAEGEWICMLDSDDEWASYYLEACNQMMVQHPKAKVFNFGSIHISLDYKATPRGTFKPEKKGKGHVNFGGGNIVNGTYIFKRECLKKTGVFPDTSSPWDMSTMAQEKYPELRENFMVDHVNEPEKIVKELGNPWGNDFLLFYMLTREYHSVPYDCNLYIVHPSRKEHKL